MEKLLDIARFPGRRWVQTLATSGQLTSDVNTLEATVRIRWARLLHVHPRDLVLFATGTEALRAAVYALLAPGDVALLAQPVPMDAVHAVLAAGARYVDVGRTFFADAAAGSWHGDAAERACAAHPDAVAYLQAPAWTGADDPAHARDLPLRARIVDARNQPACSGPRFADPVDRAADPLTLTVVTLRDPDWPRDPPLAALIAPPELGPVLRAIVGPVHVPPVLIDRAFALLDGFATQPEWPARLLPFLHNRHQRWSTLLAGHAGVQPLPFAGLQAAALCLQGNPEALLPLLMPEFPATLAIASPRPLLVTDLAMPA